MADTPQKVGTAATLAIIAAIGSFILTCTGHPIWGLVVALLAEPLGLFGFFRAASPRVRGGFISIGAIILGAIAAVVAILGITKVVVFSIF